LEKYLPSLTFAYNAMKHETTGYSPFELMFGRKPRLAIDTMFNNCPDDAISSDYVQEMKVKMERAREIAGKNIQKAQHKQKMYYDKKATSAELQVGDKVLVRILAFSGPHNISDKYEQEVYEVMEQPHQDIPVYIVRSEDGIERKLHRNHLLPVGSNNGQKITEQENPVHQRPVPQPRRLPQKVSDEKAEQKLENGTVEEDMQSESSDSEDEGDVIYRTVIE